MDTLPASLFTRMVQNRLVDAAFNFDRRWKRSLEFRPEVEALNLKSIYLLPR